MFINCVVLKRKQGFEMENKVVDILCLGLMNKVLFSDDI